MSKKIADDVIAREKAGKLFAWEKELMKENGFDVHGLSEAVAGMSEGKYTKISADILNNDKFFICHEYRDAGDFDKGSLHWSLIDAKKGVFARMGTLNHLGKWIDYKGEELALEYRFSKEEWSEDTIKSYVKESVYKADVVKIKRVQLMKAGTWNGDEYTIKDFEEMVRAHDDKVFSGGMKFGHNRSQTALKEFLDGAPRFGSVEKLYVEGEFLYADYGNVPRKLAMLLEAGAFPIKSAEVFWNMRYNDKVYPRVFKAIAFFGDNIPAVKGLDDVINLYEPEQKVASAVDKADVKVYNLDMKEKDYAKHTKAWHRCVEKVSARGDVSSPEAVCTMSLERTGNVYMKDSETAEDIPVKNNTATVFSVSELRRIDENFANDVENAGAIGIILDIANDFEITLIPKPEEVKQMTAEEKAKFDATLKENEELTKKLKAEQEDKAKVLKEKEEKEAILKKQRDEATEGDIKAKVEKLLKSKIKSDGVNALVSLYKAVADRKEKSYTLTKEGKIEAGEEVDLKAELDKFIEAIPENPEIVKMFTESAKSGGNTTEDKSHKDASEESKEMASAVDKYLSDNKLPKTAQNMSRARKALNESK